jgi:UDP-N-acetylmuramyl tripeptide synthase
MARIERAGTTPASWIRDADRRIPVVSISGTNGKSTVTRLISHMLRLAGRHVGTTTSDGVLVDERLVAPGDWTGPGGAAQVLGRADVDVAVLETARGGILLRGVGYESNEASVITNVSADHLDLQGVHTLPELAEVKATVCRITRPDGWIVLNGDGPRWRGGSGGAWRTSPSRRGRRPSCGAIWPPEGERTSSRTAFWSRRRGRGGRRSPRSRTWRSRSAG